MVGENNQQEIPNDPTKPTRIEQMNKLFQSAAEGKVGVTSDLNEDEAEAGEGEKVTVSLRSLGEKFAENWKKAQSIVSSGKLISDQIEREYLELYRNREVVINLFEKRFARISQEIFLNSEKFSDLDENLQEELLYYVGRVGFYYLVSFTEKDGRWTEEDFRKKYRQVRENVKHKSKFGDEDFLSEDEFVKRCMEDEMEVNKKDLEGIELGRTAVEPEEGGVPEDAEDENIPDWLQAAGDIEGEGDSYDEEIPDWLEDVEPVAQGLPDSEAEQQFDADSERKLEAETAEKRRRFGFSERIEMAYAAKRIKEINELLFSGKRIEPDTKEDKLNQERYNLREEIKAIYGMQDGLFSRYVMSLHQMNKDGVDDETFVKYQNLEEDLVDIAIDALTSKYKNGVNNKLTKWKGKVNKVAPDCKLFTTIGDLAEFNREFWMENPDAKRDNFQLIADQLKKPVDKGGAGLGGVKYRKIAESLEGWYGEGGKDFNELMDKLWQIRSPKKRKEVFEKVLGYVGRTYDAGEAARDAGKARMMTDEDMEEMVEKDMRDEGKAKARRLAKEARTKPGKKEVVVKGKSRDLDVRFTQKKLAEVLKDKTRITDVGAGIISRKLVGKNLVEAVANLEELLADDAPYIPDVRNSLINEISSLSEVGRRLTNNDISPQASGNITRRYDEERLGKNELMSVGFSQEDAESYNGMSISQILDYAEEGNNIAKLANRLENKMIVEAFLSERVEERADRREEERKLGIKENIAKRIPKATINDVVGELGFENNMIKEGVLFYIGDRLIVEEREIQDGLEKVYKNTGHNEEQIRERRKAVMETLRKLKHDKNYEVRLSREEVIAMFGEGKHVGGLTDVDIFDVEECSTKIQEMVTRDELSHIEGKSLSNQVFYERDKLIENRLTLEAEKNGTSWNKRLKDINVGEVLSGFRLNEEQKKKLKEFNRLYWKSMKPKDIREIGTIGARVLADIFPELGTILVVGNFGMLGSKEALVYGKKFKGAREYKKVIGAMDEGTLEDKEFVDFADGLKELGLTEEQAKKFYDQRGKYAGFRAAQAWFNETTIGRLIGKDDSELTRKQKIAAVAVGGASSAIGLAISQAARSAVRIPGLGRAASMAAFRSSSFLTTRGINYLANLPLNRVEAITGSSKEEKAEFVDLAMRSMSLTTTAYMTASLIGGVVGAGRAEVREVEATEAGVSEGDRLGGNRAQPEEQTEGSMSEAGVVVASEQHAEQSQPALRAEVEATAPTPVETRAGEEAGHAPAESPAAEEAQGYLEKAWEMRPRLKNWSWDWTKLLAQNAEEGVVHVTKEMQEEGFFGAIKEWLAGKAGEKAGLTQEELETAREEAEEFVREHQARQEQPQWTEKPGIFEWEPGTVPTEEQLEWTKGMGFSSRYGDEGTAFDINRDGIPDFIIRDDGSRGFFVKDEAGNIQAIQNIPSGIEAGESYEPSAEAEGGEEVQPAELPEAQAEQAVIPEQLKWEEWTRPSPNQLALAESQERVQAEANGKLFDLDGDGDWDFAVLNNGHEQFIHVDDEGVHRFMDVPDDTEVGERVEPPAGWEAEEEAQSTQELTPTPEPEAQPEEPAEAPEEPAEVEEPAAEEPAEPEVVPPAEEPEIHEGWEVNDKGEVIGGKLADGKPLAFEGTGVQPLQKWFAQHHPEMSPDEVGQIAYREYLAGHGVDDLADKYGEGISTEDMPVSTEVEAARAGEGAEQVIGRDAKGNPYYYKDSEGNWHYNADHDEVGATSDVDDVRVSVRTYNDEVGGEHVSRVIQDNQELVKVEEGWVGIRQDEDGWFIHRGEFDPTNDFDKDTDIRLVDRPGGLEADVFEGNGVLWNFRKSDLHIGFDLDGDGKEDAFWDFGKNGEARGRLSNGDEMFLSPDSQGIGALQLKIMQERPWWTPDEVAMAAKQAFDDGMRPENFDIDQVRSPFEPEVPSIEEAEMGFDDLLLGPEGGVVGMMQGEIHNLNPDLDAERVAIAAARGADALKEAAGDLPKAGKFDFENLPADEKQGVVDSINRDIARFALEDMLRNEFGLARGLAHHLVFREVNVFFDQWNEVLNKNLKDIPMILNLKVEVEGKQMLWNNFGWREWLEEKGLIKKIE